MNATSRLEVRRARVSDSVRHAGLGVVDPRTDTGESTAEIETAVRGALAHYPPEAIFRDPDCGFATFSRWPVSGAATARAKLDAMVAAARRLRVE